MKKFIKIFLTTILFAVIGLIVARAIVSSDRTVFKKFKVSRTTAEAYNETGGEMKIYSMPLKDKIAEQGYFAAYSMYFIPSTGEVQVTVRYNVKGAYDYTGTDSGEDFAFRLLNSESGKYYDAAAMESATRYGLYKYIKITFEGVDAAEEDELYLVMENSGGEVDRQCIHYEDQPYREYKLKGRDKKEIENIRGGQT